MAHCRYVGATVGRIVKIGMGLLPSVRCEFSSLDSPDFELRRLASVQRDYYDPPDGVDESV